VVAADFPEGMRPCDSHEVSQLNELKIDINALTFTAHYRIAGDIIMSEQMPIIGGWAGGVEETSIVNVATHLAAFIMVGADWHLDGPIHVRWGNTTAREPLMVAGHACRAVDRNTHLLLGNQYYTSAGPCTEMCLLEAAAQAITDTASGREIMSGCASAKGVALDYTTAMEARFMAYAARAVAGVETEKVNAMLDKLVSLYETKFKEAPKGKTFQECYDVSTLTPSEEYLKVFGNALKTMEKIGFEFKI
jgi:methylamine--corrinoid protein Co-methyltransferase